MISKERLEELIEQGATIYSNEYGEIQLIKENDLSLYEIGQNNYILYALEPNKKYHNEIFDEDLFETEEEAKWFAEFGCVERTEKFEPLYYDNIDQNYCYEYHFSTKNNHEYTIRVSGKDIILFWTNCNYKEYFKNTKEEYEKLIRRCAKMFLEGDYAK